MAERSETDLSEFYGRWKPKYTSWPSEARPSSRNFVLNLTEDWSQNKSDGKHNVVAKYWFHTLFARVRKMKTQFPGDSRFSGPKIEKKVFFFDFDYLSNKKKFIKIGWVLNDDWPWRDRQTDGHANFCPRISKNSIFPFRWFHKVKHHSTVIKKIYFK